jgi:hypothetical protein
LILLIKRDWRPRVSVLPICLLPSTPEEYMFEAQESKYIQLPRALQYLTPATKIFSNQTCTYIFLYDVSHFLLFNNIPISLDCLDCRKYLSFFQMGRCLPSQLLYLIREMLYITFLSYFYFIIVIWYYQLALDFFYFIFFKKNWSNNWLVSWLYHILISKRNAIYIPCFYLITIS